MCGMAMSVNRTSGRWPFDQLQCLAAVARLGDDLDTLQALEQGADAGTDKDMVVGEQDANGTPCSSSFVSRSDWEGQPDHRSLGQGPSERSAGRRAGPRARACPACPAPAARPSAARRLRIEPDAVVADDQTEDPTPELQLDPHAPGSGMTGDVRQRLLRDPEGGRRRGRAELDPVRVGDQAGPVADPLGLAVEIPPQGGNQPKVVEHRGPQVEREMTHLLDGTVDDHDAFLEPGQRHGAAGPLDRVQVDADRGEGLADLVMELPGKVAPVLLLDLDDPLGEDLRTGRVSPHAASARFRPVTSFMKQ